MSLPWRVPVNGLAGEADLRNPELAGKPRLSASLASVQPDYVHMHNLYACVGAMYACVGRNADGQSAACPGATALLLRMG
jgi:hypothetical protein